MTQKIELMADYGCYPLWWKNGDGDIDPTALPLKPETVHRLEKWADIYDGILNRDDPAASDFESEAALIAFDGEGIALWHQLREELSPNYEVGYFSERLRQHLNHPRELEILTAPSLVK